MQYITHPDLQSHPHGFFTRNGGVSTGIYDSLNMSYATADTVDNVDKNHALVRQSLGLRRMIILNQVHAHTVHKITSDSVDAFTSNTYDGDALVSNVPGVGLGVLTADCGCVLLCDPIRNIVGACHAGHNGAKQGVVIRTVESMVEMGAKTEDICAVLGPMIQQKSYGVCADFYQKYCDIHSQYACFFTPWNTITSTSKSRDTKASYGFDLSGFIIHTLYESTGVRAVQLDGCDTYDTSHMFFSYRRATHDQAPDYGRQISVISAV